MCGLAAMRCCAGASLHRSENRKPVSVSSSLPTPLFSSPCRLFCGRAFLCLFFLVLAWSLFVPVVTVAAAEAPPAVVITADMLWEQAVAARDADRSMDAAVLFQRLQDRFPGDEHAEEALWQAAQQAKLNASVAKDPNWRYVRDLFRRYTVDYPDSPRYAEAYYQGAVSYYNMKLFREALIYFNLFLKRFPESPRVQQARYWQGQTFLKVDRLVEATKVFEGLSRADDPAMRLRGFVGLGDTLFAGEQYLAALAAYKKVIAKSPDYHFDDPSLLVKLGKTYFKVGNEMQGMKQLFHYLNLDKTSRQRAEVLFALGESYHRQGDVDAAQRMYGMAVEEGASDARAVVLSRFRQAQYRDDPQRVVPDWKKSTDLSDPSGDKPYLDVLGLFYRDPVAQEARLALVRRYQARKDNLRLFEVAVNFIQHAPAGPLREEMEGVVGELLVARVAEDLSAERYQDVYDLYRADYQHVAAYGQGRLLYLIGQAFEAMTLYDQAAVIYYRALSLPLTDAEKVDLYFRRARVYLAKKDWLAADRLLTHLRKIYKGDKAVGEVFYLSGRLQEARGKDAEALSSYLQAVEICSVPEQKPQYAAAALRMLLRRKRNAEAQSLLRRFGKEEWLAPEEMQEWFGRLGDNLLRAGDSAGAAKAYGDGLAEGMPLEGEMAQSLHLRLGGALVLLGRLDAARVSFETARGGSGELWRKVADERLNQMAIDSSMLKVETILGQ